MSTNLTDMLSTNAEERARLAQDLSVFSGFSLPHTKQQLALMLSHIGRDGMFEQYTRHDITHINELLNLCDLIIPDTTKTVMSAADWLLIVLGIYFHDLGMLISTQEFENRRNSGFEEFCHRDLFSGDKGKDYRMKVESLGESKEKFLYQEYVRHTHAERIKHWILGNAPNHLGVARVAADELNRLLAPLPLRFRQDLGLICESHHRDDLHDFSKYRVSQPYGPGSEAEANVHYAALIIRSVDLLHMTSDRTPSVSFKLINPADPISQREWAKQMGVTSIRARPERNRDGEVDASIQPTTIEVHAQFQEPLGFFSLTSFLTYVRDQLRRTHDWAKQAQRHSLKKYEFPWRDIDESCIETTGFVKQKFEFTLDQSRILDLLTGHTLYNDSRVAVRELIQNAIDAIRAHQVQNPHPSRRIDYVVHVRWDSTARVLEVQDNGTGMTQDIIEHHLLKVGSSRYQDPEFQKRFPGFSPISRFGIGLLSSFMVADSVEILTCHPDDSEARHLSLRSVHGKYLIRILDKYSDLEARRVVPHGTIVRLHLRPSADLGDVTEVVERWIAIPACRVALEIDGGEAKDVGFSSVAEVLREDLRRDGILPSDEPGGKQNNPRVQIREASEGCVTLAYAVQWSDVFKEWSFLEPSRSSEAYLGSCVEGIRVEFNTPGYPSRSIYAIANARGTGAPRTNVGRSGFEDTPEYTEFLRTVYRLFLRHLTDELDELRSKRMFSLTWAVREVRYLAEPLFGRVRSSMEDALHAQSLEQELSAIPILVVESSSGRECLNVAQLSRVKNFWTIDCESVRSAERLLGEIGANASIRGLGQALGHSSLSLPPEMVLATLDNVGPVDDMVFSRREVDRIVVHRELRRIDLRWREVPGDDHCWIRFPYEKAIHVLRGDMHRRVEVGDLNVRVGVRSVEIEGGDGETAVEGFGVVYILPGTSIARLAEKWTRFALQEKEEGALLRATVIMSFIVYIHRREAGLVTEDTILRYFSSYGLVLQSEHVTEVVQAVASVVPRFFTTSAWIRNPQQWDDWD